MNRPQRIASRAEIDALRRGMAQGAALYEPGRGEGGVDWQPSLGDAPFPWDALPLPPSPKRFFFPAREPLQRWRAGTAEAAPSQEVALAAAGPFVLFGVRACDATAIAYQDAFFSGDPWYAARREAALIVVVHCGTACGSGFCLDVDAGPFARAGFDLALTALSGDRVAIQIGSARGRRALEDAGAPGVPPDDAALAAFETAKAAAEASFPARPFVATAIARLRRRQGIAASEWARLGPACFACSGCSNVCPTCSCYSIVDEGDADHGTRVRLWDSCLLEGFQREASGHHPAPSAGDRVRRFWSHKFADDFAEEFGRAGCVGCGRCDVACPGSIGALRVLHEVAAHEEGVTS